MMFTFISSINIPSDRYHLIRNSQMADIMAAGWISHLVHGRGVNHSD